MCIRDSVWTAPLLNGRSFEGIEASFVDQRSYNAVQHRFRHRPRQKCALGVNRLGWSIKKFTIAGVAFGQYLAALNNEHGIRALEVSVGKSHVDDFVEGRLIRCR